MIIRTSLILGLCVLASCSTAAPLAESASLEQRSSNTTASPSPRGWVQSPDGRGTLDIIWGCVFTTFLCSWSVLCLNLPAFGDSAWQMLRRKVYLTGLAVIGPEFLFQIALGQWLSARQSVTDFKASGYSEWTLNHAFFADMGGFVLYTRDWVPFPVNAKQLHYLVTKGYVKYPNIDKGVILDKNKMDGLVRVITLLQTLWFVITSLARVVQHLTLTAFELTTLGFIVCTIGTTYCWAQKPSDVEHPIPLESNASMADILLQAGDAASKPYSCTPLDFVSRKEWAWSMLWSNWINILKRMRIDFRPQVRPVNRRSNDEFHEISGFSLVTLFFFQITYAGILLAGWNFWFPTHIEHVLWRIATVMIMGSICSYWIIETIVFRILPALKSRLSGQFTGIASGNDQERPGRFSQWTGQGSSRVAKKARSVAKSLRNNSLQKDPELDIPLKALLPVYIVAVCYCTSRTYVLITDILELRSLPPSAFATVNWSQFLPHF
ncbi:hypothetical protein K432DRAFT_348859 [Lepidopterella palustris CBS 459.81]|uniref:Uncharacterized protein n=1 Tax=Lepidopterella palustris CBS 459.81 TaxID=1314670 RepID=A0A8E2EEG1_9PEZI|nr:hypothetical protein K432DRAFT_348859 [Lepidopterella palustris CBS 459.81]